jgi:hypothetical protein
MLQRAFRIGMTNARRLSYLDPGLTRKAERIRLASYKMATTLIPVPKALIQGRRRRALRLLCRCADAVGMILGTLGFTYEVYRQVHGR